MAPTPSRFLLGVASFAGLQLTASQQFEIPAEMLQGMMGGMMGGGGGRQQRKPTEWPKTESPEIEPQYDWLVNTEWKGKTAQYMFHRDGSVESSLKECEHEGACLWAANNGKIMINTPTLKVVKFELEGVDKADAKKLANKDETELRKVKLIAALAGKSGKKSVLEFSKLSESGEDDNILSRDLFEILDVAEDADAAAIKSKFRRLSVQHHPDKGGDPKMFAEIREAYEILSIDDNRRYYQLGGVQLVKNIELGYKEAESQAGQMDSQLANIPKNHPQYKMAKAQIDQQKKQFDRVNVKQELEKKMKSEDTEIMVPISAAELYTGVASKTYEFTRLVICRGCRADPTVEKCKECGRCPPEKVQVPKYGNTPFGRQVVAVKEKEQESRERCREVKVAVDGLRVPKGAKPGSVLKYVSDMGHQTPGKLPGKAVLKVQHGSPEDLYTIAENDLHTVLHISLEEALFGFSKSWVHLGDQKVTVSTSRATQLNKVVRIKKKGLVGEGGARGSLFVRLAIDMPTIAAGSKSLTLNQASAEKGEPKLTKEDAVELREGSTWRRWSEKENASAATDKAGKDGAKEEL